MNQLRAAPNQLTLLRLCVIPFLVLAVLDGHYRSAFVLFVLAGITDGLDGLLARWLQQRTVLGQYLDPVADKLLLSTLFLVLHHEGLISRRVTVLVFGRDLGIVMVAAILYASVGMRDFKPSIFGKANTLAQIIALLAVLLAQFYGPTGVLIYSPPRAARDRCLHGDLGIPLCVADYSPSEHVRRASQRVNPLGTGRRIRALPLHSAFLLSPCRGIRSSQRLRRIPGTRRTRRPLRAPLRALLDVCRGCS